MLLKKAIELLTLEYKQKRNDVGLDYYVALKLGIAALRRELECRVGIQLTFADRLPGETPEELPCSVKNS